MKNSKILKLYIILIKIIFLGFVISENCTSKFGKNRLNGLCEQIDDCKGGALVGTCTDNSQICCIPDNKIPEVDFDSIEINETSFKFFFGKINDHDY